ncbi:MAG: proline dehydrogenase family protein [Bacteroidetes bacterium]|nr:proline dehydrogenase family protein [Bacteroidota bacterium]
MDSPKNNTKHTYFSNTEIAFKNKDNGDLKHSLWLFRLMQNPLLVKVFSKLTLIAIKLHLPISVAVKATIYKQFCSGETLDESQKVVKHLGKSGVGSILDYSVEGKDSIEDFEHTKSEVIKIIHIAKGNPAIPYTSLKLTGIARHALLEKINPIAIGTKQELNAVEQKEQKELYERMEQICKESFACHVPIYFDAEESWIQDAIDMLAEEMMRKYNREDAIILTTLQMYRWDRMDYLKKLISEARKEKFFIGIKLVRGAYMEKENKRALEQGYKSPIQLDKQSTDIDFDKAVDTCLENIDIIKLCAGTHNEASTTHLLDQMKKLGIRNNHPNVYFSQLYGMSDNITYNLADMGYNVTKYLPYGPVKSTLPYLMRRAEENTAIAGQVSRELKMILEEKERRKFAKMLTGTNS